MGYKKLRLEEWQEIIPRVKKRALEGKDTDIYLHGRLLDPKRIKREINRYSSRVDQYGDGHGGVSGPSNRKQSIETRILDDCDRSDQLSYWRESQGQDLHCHSTAYSTATCDGHHQARR